MAAPKKPATGILWGVQTEKGFFIIDAETQGKASQKAPGKTLSVNSVAKEIKSAKPTGMKWGVLTDKGFHVVDAATESAASQKAPGKTISVKQHGSTSSPPVGKPKIIGYRRVLYGKNDCDLCKSAAAKLYHSAALLPIHPHCSCGTAPVFEGDAFASEGFWPSNHPYVKPPPDAVSIPGAPAPGAVPKPYKDLTVEQQVYLNESYIGAEDWEKNAVDYMTGENADIFENELASFSEGSMGTDEFWNFAEEKGLPQMDDALLAEGEHPTFGVNLVADDAGSLNSGYLKADGSAGAQSAKFRQKPEWRDFDKKVADLGPTHDHAIGWYQGSGYRDLNGALRNGRFVGGTSSSYSKTVMENMTKLDEVMNISATEGYNLRLWTGRGRATPDRLMAKFGTEDLESLVGTIWKDEGYLSTSLKPGVAAASFGGESGIMMEVMAPSGTRGIWMNARSSSGFSSEMEFLIDRGQEMRIVEVVRRPKGGIIIRCEIEEPLSVAQRAANETRIKMLQAQADKQAAEQAATAAANAQAAGSQTKSPLGKTEITEAIPSHLVAQFKADGWMVVNSLPGGYVKMKKTFGNAFVKLMKKEVQYGTPEYYAMKAAGWTILQKKAGVTVMQKLISTNPLA